MDRLKNLTVADIAASSLAAVRVFEQHGIDYCCGGKRSLAEVCLRKDQDQALLRQELEAALEDHAAPELDWKAASLRDLIRHIVARHHTFLRRELPAIQARLDKVYRVYNQRYGPTLTGLPEAFAALRAELEPHLEKEEAILFPAIGAIEAAEEMGARRCPGCRSAPSRIRFERWKPNTTARESRFGRFAKSPGISSSRLMLVLPTKR